MPTQTSHQQTQVMKCQKRKAGSVLSKCPLGGADSFPGNGVFRTINFINRVAILTVKTTGRIAVLPVAPVARSDLLGSKYKLLTSEEAAHRTGAHRTVSATDSKEQRHRAQRCFPLYMGQAEGAFNVQHVLRPTPKCPKKKAAAASVLHWLPHSLCPA